MKKLAILAAGEEVEGVDCCISTQNPNLWEDRTRWLAEILTIFMGSLNNALDGNFADVTDSDQMRESMLGRRGNPAWQETFDMIANRNYGDYHDVAFIIAPGGGEDSAATLLMARVHIWFDLYFAIEVAGVGLDEDWDCIGEIVASCGEDVTGIPDWYTQLGTGLKNNGGETGPNIDVMDWRREMRDQVKQDHDALGFNPFEGLYDNPHLDPHNLRGG